MDARNIYCLSFQKMVFSNIDETVKDKKIRAVLEFYKIKQ
jgi:hypothetical protein